MKQALVLISLLVFCVQGAGLAREGVIYRGTVSAYKLNIRSAPSQGASVVATVDRGTSVNVIREEGGIGGWLTVIYEGQEGYVRNRPKYITLVPVTVPVSPVPVKTSDPEVLPKQEVQASLPAQTEDARPPARKIQDEAQKVETFSQKEVEIVDGLNEIDFSLNQARVKAQALTEEKGLLEKEIHLIQDEAQMLNRSMSEVMAYAGQRLEALYRMHMMGRLEMAGPPDSLFDFFTKQRAMKQVVASDHDLLADQARDLERLARLQQELEAQVRALAALEAELTLQIRIKEKESQKKEAILKEIRQKKQLSEAALAALQEAARSLDRTLTTMGLSGRAGLDDLSFVRNKGNLPPPVQGKIISYFGKARNGDYDAYTFQSGIDIRVERGEPVRSVFKGEVMFAQWLKGYGNLVIINHGDNYYTLYAHVEEIFKKKGETVGGGEVIATAGDTGSIKGNCLHFEVRHHGKPVNPLKWIKKGA